MWTIGLHLKLERHISYDIEEQMTTLEVMRGISSVFRRTLRYGGFELNWQNMDLIQVPQETSSSFGMVQWKVGSVALLAKFVDGNAVVSDSLDSDLAQFDWNPPIPLEILK